MLPPAVTCYSESVARVSWWLSIDFHQLGGEGDPPVANIVDHLRKIASELLSAFGDFAERSGENLSDPWSAGVFVAFVILTAVLTWLSRLDALLRQPKVRIAVLALAIATLGGATFRWTLFLPGVWLVGVGITSLWGREIDARFIAPRRVARIWLPHWIARLGNTRNSIDLGLLCIVIGLAIVGGGLLHAVTALLVILPQLWRLGRREVRLLRSGEASTLFSPIWDLSVGAVVLLGLALAGATGGLLDRHFSWIDVSSSSTQGPLVLQALLAIEVAIASLSAAAIGLAIQLRSTSFGTDIAFAQLRRNRLLAAFSPLIVMIVATIAVLGQWNDAREPLDGLVPSLVVHGALLASAWVVFESISTVIELTRVRHVANTVSGLALANDWQDQLRLYGWNAIHMDTPESVYLLAQALQGAVRIGNIELLESIVRDWVFIAGTQPAIQRLNPLIPSPEALEKLAATDLAPEDADFLDGLDIALAQVVRTTAMVPGVTGPHIRALTSLAGLTSPPLSKDRHHHEIRGYSEGLPGFRTLDELTWQAAHVGDGGAVEGLLSMYWRENGRLAIKWAERLTPDDEKDGSLPRLPFAERLFELLVAYAEVPLPRSRGTIREQVVRIIVDLVSAAESRAVILIGLHKLHGVVDYDDDTLWFLWEDFGKIAQKPATDSGWLGAILDRSVSRTVSLDGRESTVSFGLHSFFEFCTALSFAIARSGDEAEGRGLSASEQEQGLAASVWALTRWAIERPPANVSLSNPVPIWRIRNALRDFLSSCSTSVAWKVADAAWDWAAERPAERLWLAHLVDGPWLRRVLVH